MNPATLSFWDITVFKIVVSVFNASSLATPVAYLPAISAHMQSRNNTHPQTTASLKTTSFWNEACTCGNVPLADTLI